MIEQTCYHFYSRKKIRKANMFVPDMNLGKSYPVRSKPFKTLCYQRIPTSNATSYLLRLGSMDQASRQGSRC